MSRGREGMELCRGVGTGWSFMSRGREGMQFYRGGREGEDAVCDIRVYNVDVLYFLDFDLSRTLIFIIVLFCPQEVSRFVYSHGRKR